MLCFFIDNNIDVIILAIGTFGTLILSICSTIYSSKKNAKNSKEIEMIKSLNSQNNYISKASYDCKSNVYHNLFKPFIDYLIDLNQTFPISYNKEKNEFESEGIDLGHNRCQILYSNRIKFTNVLYQNAPFICENEFETLLEIDYLCLKQIKEYELMFEKIKRNKDYEPKKEIEQFCKETQEIIILRDIIIASIRSSLNEYKGNIS
jgi:hypothetical protein